MSETIYIIGHKNPDADSICAAIAYADFKNRTEKESYRATRCGNSNARIDTILQRFQVPLPYFLGDVTPRVRDIMVSDVISIEEDATCAEALELIDAHDIRILPVLDADRYIKGALSVFKLGEFFIPKLREPREMRRVTTSLSRIIRALKATVHIAEDKNRVEDLFVRVGAMDIRSFGRFSEEEKTLPSQSVIIVGDRWDIQQKSIQLGVRLVVITGGLTIEDELIDQARSKGVSLIVSPYDSATTAWIIRAASTLDRLITPRFPRFRPEQRLSEIRRKIAGSSESAFFVTDDTGRLQGICTKTDFLKPIRTRLILVDHNELSQAVNGAADVNILEIIDHHRLGNLHTQQPILFLNEPVGSTCTIIADLFRRETEPPSPAVAGILMSGIISDTLNLQSPTTTEKDRTLLSWLGKIADVSPGDLADLIFSSGSVILSTSADKVIHSDLKLYEEMGTRFSVSQVEELGFANFREHSGTLLEALETLQKEENLLFAALLITDINTQNSLLALKGDPAFIEQMPYAPAATKGVFDLPGIVSRKKQLIPMLTGLLKAAGQDVDESGESLTEFRKNR